MQAKTVTFSSVLILVLLALLLSACGRAATPTLTRPTATATPASATLPAVSPSPTATTRPPLQATPTPASQPTPSSPSTPSPTPPTASDQGILPLPPHRFVGTAMVDGTGVADGTGVTAVIDGAEVAKTTTSGGYYRIDVIQPEGQRFTGKTVTFTVRGLAASQTGLWELGGVSEVNLSVGG